MDVMLGRQDDWHQRILQLLDVDLEVVLTVEEGIFAVDLGNDFIEY
jgi:hypothetical protein